MAEAATLVGVELVDHLVLGTTSRWESLKSRGIWCASRNASGTIHTGWWPTTWSARGSTRIRWCMRLSRRRARQTASALPASRGDDGLRRRAAGGRTRMEAGESNACRMHRLDVVTARPDPQPHQRAASRCSRRLADSARLDDPGQRRQAEVDHDHADHAARSRCAAGRRARRTCGIFRKVCPPKRGQTELRNLTRTPSRRLSSQTCRSLPGILGGFAAAKCFGCYRSPESVGI